MGEGMKVEARYRGRSRYFPGKIRRDNRDGTFDIDYDDGEKELGVIEDYIKILKSSDRDELSTYRSVDKNQDRYRDSNWDRDRERDRERERDRDRERDRERERERD